MSIKKKKRFPISRIIGLALIIWGIYMFVNDIEYKSTFDTFRGVQKEHRNLVINETKMIIVGVIIFFFREIQRYLEWVKYS